MPQSRTRCLTSHFPQVADGSTRTGGEVLASVFSVLFGAMMLGQTAPGITAISVARGAAVEVFDTLERVPPIDSSSKEGLKPSTVEGQVVFHMVGFSYVSLRRSSCLMSG